MANDLRVESRLCRTAKAQEVDGIEHVCLARPVLSYEAIDLGREVERGLRNILVIDDG
jgi:hypothetical protein